MGKRKKRRGHYCWCCDRRRPNEAFSGRGHRDHICKKCQRLPKTERAYRSAVRNIDRCLTWGGRIKKEQRKRFESFLTHENERVREYAQGIAERIEKERQEWREIRRQEAEEIERDQRRWRAELERKGQRIEPAVWWELTMRDADLLTPPGEEHRVSIGAVAHRNVEDAP